MQLKKKMSCQPLLLKSCLEKKEKTRLMKTKGEKFQISSFLGESLRSRPLSSPRDG